jgi:hypothetical protein
MIETKYDRGTIFHFSSVIKVVTGCQEPIDLIYSYILAGSSNHVMRPVGHKSQFLDQSPYYTTSRHEHFTSPGFRANNFSKS